MQAPERPSTPDPATNPKREEPGEPLPIDDPSQAPPVEKRPRVNLGKQRVFHGIKKATRRWLKNTRKEVSLSRLPPDACRRSGRSAHHRK